MISLWLACRWLKRAYAGRRLRLAELGADRDAVHYWTEWLNRELDL